MSGGAARCGTRVYRALLAGYPPRFRDRFGDEMAVTFGAAQEDVLQEGIVWPL